MKTLTVIDNRSSVRKSDPYLDNASSWWMTSDGSIVGWEPKSALGVEIFRVLVVTGSWCISP